MIINHTVFSPTTSDLLLERKNKGRNSWENEEKNFESETIMLRGSQRNINDPNIHGN